MPYILQRVSSSVSSIKSHMCKEKKISSLLFFTESEGRNGPQILDSRISVAPVMLPSAGQPIQNIPRPAFFVPATGVAARCGSVLPVHFHRSQQFRERRGRVGFRCSQDRILGKHVGPELTTNLPFAIVSDPVHCPSRHGEVRPLPDLQHSEKRQPKSAWLRRWDGNLFLLCRTHTASLCHLGLVASAPLRLIQRDVRSPQQPSGREGACWPGAPTWRASRTTATHFHSDDPGSGR